MTNRKNWQTSFSLHIPSFSEERLIDLKENTVNFIELTCGELKGFENFDINAKSIFKTAENQGVKIRSVHLPFAPFSFFDPASEDKAVRDNFLKIQSELIKICSQSGAEIAVVHPSGEPYSPEKRNVHINYSLESIIRLNEIAENEGIILAVENLPRSCILRDVKEIEIFKKEIPDIHFVFDSNHSLIDSNAEIIKAMGEKIVALHISDYDFIDEKHLLPGKGKVNWQEISACLEEVNYNGTWNYELSNEPIKASVLKQNHLDILSGKI